MKYALNKENWNKYIGEDVAVVFEKDGDNLKIIGTTQVERGFKGEVTLIPKVCLNGKTYSPNHIDPDWFREEYGWKTFSIENETRIK